MPHQLDDVGPRNVAVICADCATTRWKSWNDDVGRVSTAPDR